MKRAIFVCALTVIAASTPGCSRKLSPEMRGMSMTPDESHNQYKLTATQDNRMLSDDLARLFYTDHPSHLSSYPVVSTSPLPR